MIWFAMSSAGVGPLCFIKSRVNAAVYQEILEHFMLPSANKLYGDADFLSSRIWNLPTVPKRLVTGFLPMVLLCLIGQPTDLTSIENLWDIVKRKMRSTWPNNTDELKAAIKATWASITPQQCHRLIASLSRRIVEVICAKGAPTKYWVHKWTYFFVFWVN